MRALLPYYLPVPLMLLIDQLTKARASELFGGAYSLTHWLSISVVRNAEGPLGLFGLHGGWSWAPVNVMVLLILGGVAWRTQNTNTMRHLGFACMIGGALGNLSDLLFRGYVLDFIRFWRFPIFNIADLAIMLGVILVIRDLLRTPDTKPDRAPTGV